MTDRDVLVRIRGEFFTGVCGIDADSVEVIAPGKMIEKNGSRYVSFDEHLEDIPTPVKNVLKLGKDSVLLKKSGIIRANMEFTEKDYRMGTYATPLGSMILGIRGKKLSVQEDEESIRLHICYSLEIDYEHMTDCSIHIVIQSREHGNFSLQTQ